MKKALISLIILWFASSSVALESLDDVAIHGFVSQGYLVTTENNFFFSETKDGTFQFNEMALNFGTDLTDSLRVGIQFFAKDLGVLGNDEITLDYAMADYNYQDWLGLRVGKIRKPHGLYNQTRDVDAGRLTIFLPQSIYSESYRDQSTSVKGLSVYGRVLGQLDYQAYYGVYDIPLDSSFSYMMAGPLGAAPTSYDIDPFAGVFVLWNTPLEGLNLGCTYTNYEFSLESENLGTVKFSGYQAIGSVEFTYEDFVFSSEYAWNPSDTVMGGYKIQRDAEMYYAMFSYRLFYWFQFGGGYAATFADVDDRDNPSTYNKDFFLSLRFDINDHWLFKLEGHGMDGLSKVTDTDPSEDWQMYAARMTFSF